MENFKENVVEFLSSPILIYALYIYLFLMLFYLVYSVLNYFKYYSRMKSTILSIYTKMDEQEKQRAEVERQQRDIHGEGIKRDFLAKIDEELNYSELKTKFRWLTTEIYLLLVIVITMLATTISIVNLGVTVGISIGIVVFMLLRVSITLLAMRVNAKTEAQMIQFMNIVDNFAKTSDDIITVFERASRYVPGTLGNQIYDAVISARNTGDTLLALRELQDNVQNKHFKSLIRNLEIASRYETNYSAIVEDCREIFHNYIKAEKEKRTIRLNGLGEICSMLICGAFCLYTLGDLTESGNLILELQNGGIIGKGILIYLIFAVIVSLYICVFKVIINSKRK